MENVLPCQELHLLLSIVRYTNDTDKKCTDYCCTDNIGIR